MDHIRNRQENTNRQDRKQNTRATSQAQPSATDVNYMCWKCHKGFTLPKPGKPDTVKCPHCEMVHGLITSK